jgi:hypothetical protein
MEVSNEVPAQRDRKVVSTSHVAGGTSASAKVRKKEGQKSKIRRWKHSPTHFRLASIALVTQESAEPFPQTTHSGWDDVEVGKDCG